MSKASNRGQAIDTRSIQTPALLLALVAALSLLSFTNAGAQAANPAAPAVPNLTATAARQGIELTWQPVPGAARYELLTWWDLETGWQPIGGNNLTGTAYTHTNLTAGTTYFYSIRALNAEGVAGDWLVDNYPTATALAPGAATATPSPTPTATAAQTSASTATSTSTPTPTATASPLSPPEITAAATVHGIILTWDPVPNAARYELLTWWDAQIGWRPIGGANLTGTTFTHTGLTAQTTYFYSIRAINAAGQPGPWLLDDYPSATALATQTVETLTPTPSPTPTTPPTAAVTATHTPTPTPPTPSTLAPPRLSVTSTNQGMLLTWNAVPNAARYELLTWWDAAIGWSPIGGANLTGLAYTHTSVLAGRVYHYTIRAVDAAGKPGIWQPAYPSATALPRQGPPSRSAPPSAPLPEVAGLAAPVLTAALKGTNAIQLSWTPVSAAVRYELGLWWSGGSEGWTVEGGGSDLFGTSVLRGGFAAGKTFYFIVAAVDDSGRNGLFSEPASVTIPVHDRAGSAERAALVALYHATDGPNWRTNDNWLTDQPVAAWYGVFTDSNGRVNRLVLEDNRLRGAIPDLSALTNLWELRLNSNQLTGPIPNLDKLTNLTKLILFYNQLTGPLPNLGALTNLRELNFQNNRLTGPIPDLSALTKLQHLTLADNRLSGPFPDVSALNNLVSLSLHFNQLSGPILNLNHLSYLTYLLLRDNRLTGPVPDLSALTRLQSVDISGNPLCLPAGTDFSDHDPLTAGHLESLNLPPCTGAETMLTPAVPQYLTASVAAGQVTLTWSPSAGAAAYELRAWDSVSRRWQTIARALTATTFTHPVLTDGRHYDFQVRAYNANNIHSAWSRSLYVPVLPQHFPPPPQSLGVNPRYRKHLNLDGIHVVADTNVPDKQMALSRRIISGMLANRSDLHATLAAHRTTIFLDSTYAGGGVAHSGPGPWTILMTIHDPYCHVFIHELAHLVHFALADQPRGHEFSTRLETLFQDAMNAGRWTEMYAEVNASEYWAETVRYWFWGSLADPFDADCRFGGATCFPLEQTYSKLSDYDPQIANLIQEVFGATATVPPACKP